MYPPPVVTRISEGIARTPTKAGQAPLRATQIARGSPGERSYEVRYEGAIFELRRYRPSSPRSADGFAGDGRIPVVIAYPFINDPSILDSRPGRSVIGGLLDAGFPVYVVEWRDASAVDRSIDLGDVCVRYLEHCVDAVREEVDVEGVHLLGYSTSAPIAAAYAAIDPERVRTLVLQGAPLDFSGGEGVGLLRGLAARMDHGKIADRFGAVPPAVLESAFVLRKPVEYAITNPLRLLDHLDDEEYVEDFGRKLAWTRGGPAIPNELYREFVEKLVLNNRLMRNELRFRGTHTDLESLTMPILLVLGTEDAFVPPEASVLFLDTVPSTDTNVVDVPTGHVGLSVAPEAHERGWPAVHDWLDART